jgi:hypothetical protein
MIVVTVACARVAETKREKKERKKRLFLHVLVRASDSDDTGTASFTYPLNPRSAQHSVPNPRPQGHWCGILAGPWVELNRSHRGPVGRSGPPHRTSAKN